MANKKFKKSKKKVILPPRDPATDEVIYVRTAAEEKIALRDLGPQPTLILVPVKMPFSKKSHPKYSEMILEAIRDNKKLNMSRPAIAKFVAERYQLDPTVASRHVNLNIKKMLETGAIRPAAAAGRRGAGSYRLGQATKDKKVKPMARSKDKKVNTKALSKDKKVNTKTETQKKKVNTKAESMKKKVNTNAESMKKKVVTKTVSKEKKVVTKTVSKENKITERARKTPCGIVPILLESYFGYG